MNQYWYDALSIILRIRIKCYDWYGYWLENINKGNNKCILVFFKGSYKCYKYHPKPYNLYLIKVWSYSDLRL